MLKEFKEFALRGNMVDLAIGVIIGGAFGGLVNSIVADLLMPVIGFITGGIDFTNLYVQLSGPPVVGDLAAARKAGATIAYGNFVTLAINFLIIAFVLFLVVKAINRMQRPNQPVVEAPPEVPADVALLAEIRDLLKKG
ncbi:MAG: mscL [Proteobacteria bacterium]|nr:mscL [Pseudomonadota bacterium]